MQQLGEARKQWAGPVVIGSDFNTTPDAVRASGIEEPLQMLVTAPESIEGTCKSQHGGRTIDFFLVSRDIAQGLKDVQVIEHFWPLSA